MSKGLSLDEAFREYASSPVGNGRKAPSAKTQDARLKRLIYFKIQCLSRWPIQRDKIVGYQNWLSVSPRAPASQRAYLQTVLSFCRWAHKRGYLEEDITYDITLPNGEAEEAQIFEPEELSALIEAGDLHDRVIVSVLLDTALRAEEACSLRFVDIRADGAISLVGKGNRRRTVVLSQLTLERVGYWQARKAPTSDNLIFGLQPGGLRKRLARLGDHAGIGGRVHPHRFRHTSLTMYSEKVADLDAVRALAGHADLKTTQRYLHADERRIRGAVQSANLVAGL